MTKPEELERAKADVQEELQALAKDRPEKLEVAVIAVKSKLPYKAMAIRGALIWRVEELGRCAIEALERNDVAVGLMLTRGVMECTALMGCLVEVVEKRNSADTAELSEVLDKMLYGWKNDAELPEAINVMTLLKHLNRRFESSQRNYEHLSEFAHPNWGGVLGLFSRTDNDRFTTYFGRFEERIAGPRSTGVMALAASLSVFRYDYLRAARVNEGWLSELEPL